MLGLKLVKHAVKMLFHDVWATARLTLLPFFVVLLVFFVMFFLFSDTNGLPFSSNSTSHSTATPPGAGFFLGISLLFVFVLLVTCWAAVGWHRFVLLDELPGALLPRINKPYVLSYVWAAFRIAFAMIVLMIPVSVLIQFVFSSENVVAILAAISVIWIVLSALSFRISLVLPAAAVGRGLSLRQSWQASEGYFGTLVVVVVTTFLLNFLMQLVVAYLASTSISLILGMVLGWFSFALGISILTTLYGVVLINERSERLSWVRISDKHPVSF